MEYSIKKAGRQDLPDIARCHKASFPNSLSSRMGIAYLQKMLEWYLSTDYSFLFVVESKEDCLGYCGGMIKDGKSVIGSASSMAQYSFAAAVIAFAKRPWLFFHPEFLSKYKFVLKNIKARLFKTKQPPLQGSQNYAPYIALVVIGVHPAAQGKGLGSMLLKEFERIAVQGGYHDLRLTVRSDNLQAIKSYERNGWQKIHGKDGSTQMSKVV